MSSTPIADMVREMLSGGVSPEVIVLAVQAAELAAENVHRNRVDETAERRRAWDRNRKRESRHLRLPDSEWLPLVEAVLHRDGHRCRYCGTAERLTADHIVPMSRGGTHDLVNLSACCLACNTKKGNKLLSEWLPSTGSGGQLDLKEIPPIPPKENTSLNLPLIQSTEEEKLVVTRARGGSLPDGWRPEDRDYQYGSELGLTPAQVDGMAEDMRLWAGANANRAVARKLDWSQTFKGWMRREAKRKSNGRAPKKTASERAFELADEWRRREREAGIRGPADDAGSDRGSG